MKLPANLRWFLAPALLLAGAALLVADSAEPPAKCDNVAPLERSYEALLTCEEGADQLHIFEGHLSLALSNARVYDHESVIHFDPERVIGFAFEEYAVRMDYEADTDIEGLRVALLENEGRWSATCPDNQGTANVRSLRMVLEVALQAEGEPAPQNHLLNCSIGTEADQQDFPCSFQAYDNQGSCELSLVAQRNDL